MLNKVILIGRLTKDPELRYTPGGHAVSTFVLAVDRPFTAQDGERKTDFIKVVSWRKLAEAVAQNLSKGRLVAVDGSLQIESYDGKDGNKKLDPKVVAEKVRFLSWPRKDSDISGEDLGDAEGFLNSFEM